MGRARWAGPNWPDILEGRAMKLVARIEFGPIGPARISPQPIQVRVGLARLARIFIFILLLLIFNIYIYIYI